MLFRSGPWLHALGVRAWASEDPAIAAVIASAYAGLVACSGQAISEAFTLVRRYGVSPHVMREVMTDGLFGSSGVYRQCADAILGETTGRAARVSARQAFQALEMLMALAEAAAVPMPSVDACRDRLLGVVARGLADESWTAIADEQAQACALETAICSYSVNTRTYLPIRLRCRPRRLGPRCWLRERRSLERTVLLHLSHSDSR